MPTPHLPTFTARVIPGVQRGRKLGTPTFNFHLEDVPSTLAYGIYACFVHLDDEVNPLPAVMHYGPRPVFKDTVSCEVHVIDELIDRSPKRLTVTVVDQIREVMDFPLTEVLLAQMQSDIAIARNILGLSPTRK